MKLLTSVLIFLSFTTFAQTNILTADSTGNVFVVFVKNDSTAVVFRGKHTAFTTDGIFAKNLTSFDLKFEGFSRFNIKKNESDLGNPTEPIDPIIPPDTTEVIPSEETVAFPVSVRSIISLVAIKSQPKHCCYVRSWLQAVQRLFTASTRQGGFYLWKRPVVC